jgi:hypothetical protein
LWQFQWWDREFVLAMQVERYAAAGKDLQLGSGGKQFGNDRYS